MTELPAGELPAGELLAAHTTLRLGGPAARFVTVSDTAELVRRVLEVDRAGEPLLVLGGGSNLVIADEGFDGTVLAVRTRGLSAEVESCCGAMLTVAAGEPWDAVVAHAVTQGWSGMETLSGIPGLTGATPIQNVGAYGSEVAETLARVRALDRQSGRVVLLTSSECGFEYRSSRFKAEPDRWVILEVSFQLPLNDRSQRVLYPELASALSLDKGGRASMAAVRAAVLSLRAAKGMVVDVSDPDSVSAGSFFTNPVLTPPTYEALVAAVHAELGPNVTPPAYRAANGATKTSAAWLIEHAGFGRGFGAGAVGISSKHTLALVNRGSATTGDLLALARQVRDGVQNRFGVTLEPEPVLVGCSL